VVSRAIVTEVREGRGCGPNKDHVQLKLDHLDSALIRKRLPAIRDTVLTFAGVDLCDTPAPVFPTAHYTMGGIPTNRFGEVVAPIEHGPEERIPGLYAAGECACVSVHGGNRLGGNSLLDIIVFGRAAGNQIIEYLGENRYHQSFDDDCLEPALQRLARWERPGKGESVDGLRRELAQTMEDHCGVFRTAEVLNEGVDKMLGLQQRMVDVRLRDHSQVFNTARIEALELENLMDVAVATMLSAQQREESRGAHSRIDFPERDDVNWLRHSLYHRASNSVDYKPVRTKPLTVDSFPPKPRSY
jgi:succinate dehydrogenase / fumarate reductase flavoprotein subunit